MTKTWKYETDLPFVWFGWNGYQLRFPLVPRGDCAQDMSMIIRRQHPIAEIHPPIGGIVLPSINSFSSFIPLHDWESLILPHNVYFLISLLFPSSSVCINIYSIFIRRYLSLPNPILRYAWTSYSRRNCAWPLVHMLFPLWLPPQITGACRNFRISHLLAFSSSRVLHLIPASSSSTFNLAISPNAYTADSACPSHIYNVDDTLVKHRDPKAAHGTWDTISKQRGWWKSDDI